MSKQKDEKQHEHFETDSERIVHRHLADENDIITDEDVRNVRISTERPPAEIVTTGAEAESLLRTEAEEDPKDRPATPWDVVE